MKPACRRDELRIKQNNSDLFEGSAFPRFFLDFLPRPLWQAPFQSACPAPRRNAAPRRRRRLGARTRCPARRRHRSGIRASQEGRAPAAVSRPRRSPSCSRSASAWSNSAVPHALPPRVLPRARPGRHPGASTVIMPLIAGRRAPDFVPPVKAAPAAGHESFPLGPCRHAIFGDAATLAARHESCDFRDDGPAATSSPSGRCQKSLPPLMKLAAGRVTEPSLGIHSALTGAD